MGVVGDRNNNAKYLNYLSKVMQLLGYNLESIVNVLETAKNFLVRIISFCVLISGTFTSAL